MNMPWPCCHFCDALPGEDPQLKGVISLSCWKRICKSTTNLSLDWILLARLVGGASINNLRYMETLNRFGFKIASQARNALKAYCIILQNVCCQHLPACRVEGSIEGFLRSWRAKWPAVFWLLSTSRSCKLMSHYSSLWASFARHAICINLCVPLDWMLHPCKEQRVARLKKRIQYSLIFYGCLFGVFHLFTSQGTFGCRDY